MPLNAIFGTAIPVGLFIVGTIFFFRLNGSLNPRNNNTLVNIFGAGLLNLIICALVPIASLNFGGSVGLIVYFVALAISIALCVALYKWWKHTESELGLVASIAKHLDD